MYRPRDHENFLPHDGSLSNRKSMTGWSHTDEGGLPWLSPCSPGPEKFIASDSCPQPREGGEIFAASIGIRDAPLAAKEVATTSPWPTDGKEGLLNQWLWAHPVGPQYSLLSNFGPNPLEADEAPSPTSTLVPESLYPSANEETAVYGGNEHAYAALPWTPPPEKLLIPDSHSDQWEGMELASSNLTSTDETSPPAALEQTSSPWDLGVASPSRAPMGIITSNHSYLSNKDTARLGPLHRKEYPNAYQDIETTILEKFPAPGLVPCLSEASGSSSSMSIGMDEAPGSAVYLGLSSDEWVQDLPPPSINLPTGLPIESGAGPHCFNHSCGDDCPVDCFGSSPSPHQGLSNRLPASVIHPPPVTLSNPSRNFSQRGRCSSDHANSSSSSPSSRPAPQILLSSNMSPHLAYPSSPLVPPNHSSKFPSYNFPVKSCDPSGSSSYPFYSFQYGYDIPPSNSSDLKYFSALFESDRMAEQPVPAATFRTPVKYSLNRPSNDLKPGPWSEYPRRVKKYPMRSAEPTALLHRAPTLINKRPMKPARMIGLDGAPSIGPGGPRWQFQVQGTTKAKDSEEKPHKCHPCGQSFERGEHLTRHKKSTAHRKTLEDRKIPLDEPPPPMISCSFCGRQFNRADNLKPHLKTHMHCPGENKRNVEVSIEE